MAGSGDVAVASTEGVAAGATVAARAAAAWTSRPPRTIAGCCRPAGLFTGVAPPSRTAPADRPPQATGPGELCLPDTRSDPDGVSRIRSARPGLAAPPADRDRGYAGRRGDCRLGGDPRRPPTAPRARRPYPHRLGLAVRHRPAGAYDGWPSAAGHALFCLRRHDRTAQKPSAAAEFVAPTGRGVRTTGPPPGATRASRMGDRKRRRNARPLPGVTGGRHRAQPHLGCRDGAGAQRIARAIAAVFRRGFRVSDGRGFGSRRTRAV